MRWPVFVDHYIRAWRAATRLEISVWDGGPGIAEGDLSRIFDKFPRGDKESAVPGVGLGLAICKTIIESHGGQVWAERRAEGGAAFRSRCHCRRPLKFLMKG